MRLALRGIFVVLLVMAPGGGRGESRAVTRRALLIANSAYQHLPPLQTSRPNVDALARALSKANFEPKVAYDLPQTDLISTIRQFTEAVQPGDFVLIYYSGYGYQADELNYILPVGFDPQDQSAPGLAAFSVRNLQRRLEQRQAGTRMLVLDASRPATGLPNGLAAMRPASNTLVSFATQPDQLAPDPPGGGVDVYTSTLIRALGEPGARPASVLLRTRAEVSRLSAGKQVPHVIGCGAGLPACLDRRGSPLESAAADFLFTPPPVSTANGGSKAPDTGAGVIAANPKAGGGAAVIDPNAGALSGAPMWAMDGGDSRRSGYAPTRGPRTPRIAWSVEAGSRDANSPLIGPDGRVYVWSARDRMVRCVDNGRIVWSVPLPLNEQVGFGPDGSLQLTSFTGRTRTLNADGKPIRDGQSDGRYLGLFVWRGHAYNSNGITPRDMPTTRWYFFRADDQDWRVELDSKATRPSVDDAGTLYVGTSKGTLYSVSDAATILWSYSTGAGPTAGLAVAPGREVLAAIGDSLFRVRQGRLLWRFAGDGSGNTSPPIDDQGGTIYFGKGTDFYAVSASGKELWRLKLGDTVTTAAAMDRSGRIYVASATRLYCISDTPQRF